MARRGKQTEPPDTDGSERGLLGQRLRILRARRRLTLSDVALGTGLSRSFVALLESGQTDISVSRLLRLAEFYGVWISDLVGSIGPAVEILHPGDAAPMTTDDDGVELVLLTRQPVRGLLPFLVRLSAGSTLEGGVAHTGEEFVHCMDGEVELVVVDSIHELQAGDTASYPGRLPHSYRNSGKGTAILIGAITRG
jgi:transcriptional regulator with XRE-family HTH domain